MGALEDLSIDDGPQDFQLVFGARGTKNHVSWSGEGLRGEKQKVAAELRVVHVRRSKNHPHQHPRTKV